MRAIIGNISDARHLILHVLQRENSIGMPENDRMSPAERHFPDLPLMAALFAHGANLGNKLLLSNALNFHLCMFAIIEKGLYYLWVALLMCMWLAQEHILALLKRRNLCV